MMLKVAPPGPLRTPTAGHIYLQKNSNQLYVAIAKHTTNRHLWEHSGNYDGPQLLCVENGAQWSIEGFGPNGFLFFIDMGTLYVAE